MVKYRPPRFWEASYTLGILAIFIVLGVPLTVETAYLGAKEVGETRAYDSAPTCTSNADVSNCRFQGQARIVRTWTDKNYRWVEVAFDQLGGRKASADLDPNAPVEWQRWQPEDQVYAELWQGWVTVIDGVRTIPNPDINQGQGITTAAWITGPVTAILAVLFVWVWVLWRRATRAKAMRLLTAGTEHPVTTQQMPLTPEMKSFLQKEASVAAQPLQLALVIAGFAAVIPAILSVVLAFRQLLFTWYTLVIWVPFLGLGALLTAGVLRDAGAERRDLDGGVFNRATGAFSVKLNQSKYGTNVQVVISERTLSTVTAPALESIESDTGTVDYLPVSGDLIEVRDETGQVLWTRFDKVPTEPAAAQSAAR